MRQRKKNYRNETSRWDSFQLSVQGPEENINLKWKTGAEDKKSLPKLGEGGTPQKTPLQKRGNKIFNSG